MKALSYLVAAILSLLVVVVFATINIPGPRWIGVVANLLFGVIIGYHYRALAQAIQRGFSKRIIEIIEEEAKLLEEKARRQDAKRWIESSAITWSQVNTIENLLDKINAEREQEEGR